MKQYTETIRALIANAQLKEAIAELRDMLKDSPQLNDVIQQSARLSDIHRQIRNGLVDFKEANLTKNQVSQALLEILTEMDKTAEYNPTVRQEMAHFTTQKIKKQVNINVQKSNNYAGDFVGGHKTGNVGGNFHGGNVVHGEGQIVDVGLDRAVQNFGKQTTSLFWKVVGVAAVLVVAVVIFLYVQDQNINAEEQRNAYNGAVSRMKNDLVNLRVKNPNSPIQTMSDFEDFKIEKTVESANRLEYQVLFNSSSASVKPFKGNMILVYDVTSSWFSKDFILAEWRDLSQPKIFNTALKSSITTKNTDSDAIQPSNKPESAAQSGQKTDAPDDQVTEYLKLVAGQPARVLVEITMSSGLNIRDGQNVEGTNVVATIPYKGKAVVKKVGKPDVVSGYEHFWYWVEYNGIEGWVWGRWLQFPQ